MAEVGFETPTSHSDALQLSHSTPPKKNDRTCCIHSGPTSNLMHQSLESQACMGPGIAGA